MVHHRSDDTCSDLARDGFFSFFVVVRNGNYESDVLFYLRSSKVVTFNFQKTKYCVTVSVSYSGWLTGAFDFKCGPVSACLFSFRIFYNFHGQFPSQLTSEDQIFCPVLSSNLLFK